MGPFSRHTKDIPTIDNDNDLRGRTTARRANRAALPLARFARRLARPALGLLEAERLLAVVERDFDAPTLRVPGDHHFRGRFVARRVKHLLAATTLQGLDRHNAQSSLGHRKYPCFHVGQSCLLVATINLQRHMATTPGKHLLGCGQAITPLAWPTALAFLSMRRRVVEPRVFDQPTGQIAVIRQHAQHALAAIGTIGYCVKPLVFSMFAQDFEQLDSQCRPRSIRPSMLGRCFFIQVHRNRMGKQK